MQGIGWLVRQAIAYSNITVNLEQYTDDEGKCHIDLDQVSTGGIRSNEARILDWERREKEDGIFGKLRSQSRYPLPFQPCCASSLIRPAKIRHVG